MTTSLCFSGLVRGLALAATVLGFACADGGCGDAQRAKKPARDARLSGRVEVCTANFGKCSPVAATVTLLSVQGATLGSAVGKKYAANGRFSFDVAPGKYFPTASTAQARVADRRCFAGEAVVRAGEDVTDSVSCVPRVTGAAKRREAAARLHQS
jgi:hypothetical protein